MLRPLLLATSVAVAVQPAPAAFNFFNPAFRDSIPKVISGTGMYKDIRAKSISDDVHYFDVNTPLWTDGAAKSRYVVVPPGTSIAYNDTADTYGYPDHAMVIKNFAVDTVAGDPSTRLLVETRFTAVRKAGTVEKWYLFTYRWRTDQSDADLVPDSGISAIVPVHRAGAASPAFQKKWRFPSVAQCAACHRNGIKQGRTVLAFFTAQLNRPLGTDPSINQLTRFFDIGLLTSAGPRPDFTRSPRWARIDQEDASLEHRSRSYIAANCSGCHGQRGVLSGATPNVTMDFDYHDLRVRTDMVTKKLFGAFPVDSSGLLVPGRPDRSIVLFRQQQRNQVEGDFTLNKFSMPPLGSYEPDTVAIKVMTRWIEGMGASSVHGATKEGLKAVRVQSGRIYLPHGLAVADDGLCLVDIRGRIFPLEKVDEGVYRIGSGIRPGLHFLVVDGKILQRLMF